MDTGFYAGVDCKVANPYIHFKAVLEPLYLLAILFYAICI